MDDKGDAKTGFTGQEKLETWFSYLSILKIDQKTPLRVLHRRPLAVRTRIIHSMETCYVDEHHFRLYPRLKLNVFFSPLCSTNPSRFLLGEFMPPLGKRFNLILKLFRKGLGCRRIFFVYLRYFDLLNLFFKWHCKSRGSSQFTVNLKIGSVYTMLRYWEHSKGSENTFDWFMPLHILQATYWQPHLGPFSILPQMIKQGDGWERPHFTCRPSLRYLATRPRTREQSQFKSC